MYVANVCDFTKEQLGIVINAQTVMINEKNKILGRARTLIYASLNAYAKTAQGSKEKWERYKKEAEQFLMENPLPFN